MHRTQRKYQAIIRAAGAEIISVEMAGSSHIKYRCRVGNRLFLYVCPNSGSDCRNDKNIRADIRRLVRGVQ